MKDRNNPTYPPDKVMYLEVQMDAYFDPQKVFAKISELKDCQVRLYTPKPSGQDT